MTMYKAIRELWKQPKESLGDLFRQRLIQWRQEEAITSLERPTRLDRARSLGYKPKKGISMVRVRVQRGGRMREWRSSGRRSKTQRRKKIVGVNYQWVAEQRAQRHFRNLEVLNSYYVGHDGIFAWYEVIMVDPHRPEIKADKRLNWICFRKHTNRVFRGQTSAGQRSRGLRKKGIGAEKLRPSHRAHKRLTK